MVGGGWGGAERGWVGGNGGVIHTSLVVIDCDEGRRQRLQHLLILIHELTVGVDSVALPVGAGGRG
jgi:hypothetical protein